jgi:ATP-dependent RNA helicase RhlE
MARFADLNGIFAAFSRVRDARSAIIATQKGVLLTWSVVQALTLQKTRNLLFENLNLGEPILKALSAEGYIKPTPIQEQAIPVILQSKDLLGCAQTGTGKTAAFALPILQKLYEQKALEGGLHGIQVLIVTPTRELAIQIDESFTAYGKYTGISHMAIFGGVPLHGQTQKIKKGASVLVATPGRLLDLVNQGFISLKQIRIFVLDEADRMLDMGFIHDVKKIISMLPPKRQTLMFSATMPSEIGGMANAILHHPVRVEVTPVSSTVEKVKQEVYFVDKSNKLPLLIHLLKGSLKSNALIFARTKHGADKIAKHLNRAQIKASAIHGNKTQGARQRALQDFKTDKIRVLVATDIAARGIDVESLSHVINYDLPNVPETYVHRIGRTGRAGAAGTASSFCDGEEKAYLKDITKLIARSIPVVDEHPFPLQQIDPPTNTPVNQRHTQQSQRFSHQKRFTGQRRNTR